MKISVLTVCFNAETTIRQTLDSFCAQTHSEREMIVIDGASTDGTVALAREYESDWVRVISEPDQGMYDALNKGLKLYSGDAFGVLNADDVYHHSDVLAHVAEGLELAPIVQGHLDFVADHVSKNIVRHWQGEARPASGFKSGWMPAHPTFYVRREVASMVGEFDTTLDCAADYDWMLRAIDVFGFEVALLNSILVDMKIGGKSTKDMLAQIRHNLEALSVRRRWLDAGLIDYALLAKPLRKLGQFVQPAKRKIS
jgi:glycosyltransferase involved in cell wall biosynthesis